MLKILFVFAGLLCLTGCVTPEKELAKMCRYECRMDATDQHPMYCYWKRSDRPGMMFFDLVDCKVN